MFICLVKTGNNSVDKYSLVWPCPGSCATRYIHSSRGIIWPRSEFLWWVCFIMHWIRAGADRSGGYCTLGWNIPLIQDAWWVCVCVPPTLTPKQMLIICFSQASRLEKVKEGERTTLRAQSLYAHTIKSCTVETNHYHGAARVLSVLPHFATALIYKQPLDVSDTQSQ